MAVPRSRLSNQRKNTRRSHHAKAQRTFSTCAKCGRDFVPHTICQGCGTYSGRVVVQPAEQSA